MKSWSTVMVFLGVLTWISWAQAEDRGRAQPAAFGDRTPLITLPDPDQVRDDPEPADVVHEERTLEERVEELEHLVRRLVRMVDPYNHRDERRLERRLRNLERQMEEVEQELRRLENRLRAVELRR